MIKALDNARGNGTSMISLILPPKSQISQTQAMLANEYGTASNIKSRVNRQSVLAAITSAQQRLKLYSKVPPNGLIVYTGTVLTEDGKEKKLNVDFEPFKPINTSLYLCDNKFHTEALDELMESDNRYGFIVMDGNGSLFGTLSGNNREVLHKVSVDLPKKHGRGGQSALRFARLRMEKRHNYVRKVAELAVQFFISSDKPNVAGIILAGSADFKTELSQSDMFDARLQSIILAVVDVSYGRRRWRMMMMRGPGWVGLGIEQPLMGLVPSLAAHPRPRQSSPPGNDPHRSSRRGAFTNFVPISHGNRSNGGCPTYGFYLCHTHTPYLYFSLSKNSFTTDPAPSST